MSSKHSRPYVILVTALIINSVTAWGQLKITGTINDSSNSPLAHATVKLLKEDNTILQTGFSDSTGNFIFLGVSPGSYILEGSYVGVKGITKRFSLGKDTSVVVIVNSRPTGVLKEVTVTANKPMIERKIDRLVFNVENSIAAKGMDLTQALALTPMLRVDDNGVSIVGKSGVSVMINNRLLNLGGADLINYLRSLRSDDIARIEVITAPPAKYEAQGNSGMINIVLKKNPNIGWSGNISTSYIQATYPGYANNFNLNYQSHRLSSSLKLRQYHRMTHPTEEISIIGTTSILSRDSRKDMAYGLGGNLSTDYKISDKANIGFIYDIGKLHYNMDITNSTTYQSNNSTDSVLATLSQQRNPTFTQTLNVYYDQKLGHPGKDNSGKLLSTGFNYFSTMPQTNTGLQTSSDRTSVTDFVKNSSDLHYNIWSAQSDLTLPYHWVGIETGLKFTNFSNNSAVSYYNLMQGDYKIDSSKSNLFDYNEKNIAGYFSAQKDFTKTWSAKAGLRYEYSIIDGYSPTNGEQNKSQYGKLFPSVYITYKQNASNTFSFNYSKRINRPNFRAISSFRWYVNPYSYYTGNPLLKPSFNNNAELSYLYKSIFTLTLYGQKLSNGYGTVVEVNNANKVLSYKNYLTQFNMGVEATLGLKFFPWWENREFMSFNISNATSAIREVLPQKGYTFYYSTYNTFAVTKALNVFLNFWHSLPANDGNVYSQNRYALSSGVKLALADGKFQINASVDDILRGTVSRGKVYYQGFTQDFNNYYDSRRLTLSVTYTFGKAKVKGNKKQVNFKETQRAN